MDLLKLRPFANLILPGVAATLLIVCPTAGAQTAPTIPAEPAPAVKVPPKKAAKPLTPAQAAAQERAQAAQEKAQAAREARAAQKTQTAAKTNAATPAAIPTAATAATAATATTATPAPTAPPAAGASATPRTAQSGTTSAASGTVGTGTLAWGTRVYSSTGCVHNGNSAVCTFSFVNQGNEATLAAGGAGELSGIQLVDDAHVPHRWNSAYFMDKYGAQQQRLIVEPGDTGTYVVQFPNVNPKVAGAEFHLRQQIIGGITVGAAPSNTAAAPAAAPTAAAAK